MKSNIAAAGFLASAFFLLFAGDCSDGIDLSGQDNDDDGDIGGIETNLTDPAAVIEAHDRCWQEQNHAAYEALLDDEFEFEPLAEDVDDFPWMTSDSWGRTTELGMASNMFDDNYTQGNGAVDLIELDSTLQGPPQTIDDETTRVTTTQIGRVMWTATDGSTFDTGAEIDLVSRDGFLRIKRIKELPRSLTRGTHSVEDTSWGRIKALYRDFKGETRRALTGAAPVSR